MKIPYSFRLLNAVYETCIPTSKTPLPKKFPIIIDGGCFEASPSEYGPRSDIQLTNKQVSFQVDLLEQTCSCRNNAIILRSKGDKSIAVGARCSHLKALNKFVLRTYRKGERTARREDLPCTL